MTESSDSRLTWALVGMAILTFLFFLADSDREKERKKIKRRCIQEGDIFPQRRMDSKWLMRGQVMSNVDLVKYQQVTSCSLLSLRVTTKHCDMYHPLKQQLDEVMKMMSRQRTKECKEEGRVKRALASLFLGCSFLHTLLCSLIPSTSSLLFLPLFFTSAFSSPDSGSFFSYCFFFCRFGFRVALFSC